MIRWFFKVIYLCLSIMSLLFLINIFSGQVFTRKPPVDLKPKNENDSVAEMWPFKMSAGPINYVCDTPEPNVDVTEEKLIAAWHLPSKSRLSPIMRKIGLCHVAAQELEATGIKFDTNRCNCLRSWPVAVVVLAIFCLLFNLYRLIFGFKMDKMEDGFVGWNYNISLIPFFGWFLVFMIVSLFMVDVIDLGMTYTGYGLMYPTNYYSESHEWIGIFKHAQMLYYGNGLELSIRFLIFLIECCTTCGLGNAIQGAKSWIVPKAKILVSIPYRFANEPTVVIHKAKVRV